MAPALRKILRSVGAENPMTYNLNLNPKIKIFVTNLKKILPKLKYFRQNLKIFPKFTFRSSGTKCKCKFLEN